MKDAYKPVWVILFVVAGMVAVVGIARMQRFGSAGDGKGSIAWQTDLAAAQDRSAKENKPVLAYFTASWCGPCQQMKRGTWADSAVAAAVAERYLPVMIDVDDQPAVARQFGVQGIPRIEVIGPTGDRRTLAEGYAEPAEMLGLLKGS